jgi:hypothetical protein
MAFPTAEDETPSCRPAMVKLRKSAACTKALSQARLSMATLNFGHQRPKYSKLSPNWQLPH